MCLCSCEWTRLLSLQVRIILLCLSGYMFSVNSLLVIPAASLQCLKYT